MDELGPTQRDEIAAVVWIRADVHSKSAPLGHAVASSRFATGQLRAGGGETARVPVTHDVGHALSGTSCPRGQAATGRSTRLTVNSSVTGPVARGAHPLLLP